MARVVREQEASRLRSVGRRTMKTGTPPEKSFSTSMSNCRFFFWTSADEVNNPSLKSPHAWMDLRTASETDSPPLTMPPGSAHTSVSLRRMQSTCRHNAQPAASRAVHAWGSRRGESTCSTPDIGENLVTIGSAA